MARTRRTTPIMIAGGASATRSPFTMRVARPSTVPFAASTTLTTSTAATASAAARSSTGFAPTTHSASKSVAPSREVTRTCSQTAGLAIPSIAKEVKTVASSRA